MIMNLSAKYQWFCINTTINFNSFFHSCSFCFEYWNNVLLAEFFQQSFCTALLFQVMHCITLCKHQTCIQCCHNAAAADLVGTSVMAFIAFTLWSPTMPKYSKAKVKDWNIEWEKARNAKGEEVLTIVWLSRYGVSRIAAAHRCYHSSLDELCKLLITFLLNQPFS